MTMPNPFLEYLEGEPKAAYYSYTDQWGGRKQQNFYQNRFTELYNQYLGTLGTQIRQGLMPTGTWNNYLGGFDFGKWYRDQTSLEKGTSDISGLAPQVRWDVLRR